MAVLVLGFLSVLVCVSGIGGEPQCSPFHYHEQLLERMIDVKYKMDALAKKMDKWETIVSGKVEKMDELFKMSKQLESRINEELESQQSHLNNTLVEFSKSLALSKGNDEDKIPQVLFKARSARDSSPSKGDTVIFQTIVQNQGSGYSTTTGIFTAPVGGTYLFHTQFSVYVAKELSVNIVANGKVVTAATFGDKDWSYMSSSTEGVATLEQGDEVMVRVAYATSSPIIYSDSSEKYWSYFSGILLNI